MRKARLQRDARKRKEERLLRFSFDQNLHSRSRCCRERSSARWDNDMRERREGGWEIQPAQRQGSRFERTAEGSRRFQDGGDCREEGERGCGAAGEV